MSNYLFPRHLGRIALECQPARNRRSGTKEGAECAASRTSRGVPSGHAARRCPPTSVPCGDARSATTGGRGAPSESPRASSVPRARGDAPVTPIPRPRAASLTALLQSPDPRAGPRASETGRTPAAHSTTTTTTTRRTRYTDTESDPRETSRCAPPPAFHFIVPLSRRRRCPLPRGGPPTRAARVAHLPPPTSTARPRRMTITTRKTVAGRVRADERTVRDARPNSPPLRGSLVPSLRTHRAFPRGTKHPTPRSV